MYVGENNVEVYYWSDVSEVAFYWEEATDSGERRLRAAQGAVTVAGVGADARAEVARQARAGSRGVA